MVSVARRLGYLRRKGRKALGTFITCGFPSVADTVEIMAAMAEGGADFIELGMPFSDPLAEGLPIQRSSAHALAQGTTMDDVFETVSQFSGRSNTPVVLMGYINPILQFGLEEFLEEANALMVSGLVICDLPPEESAVAIEPICADYKVGLIHLIAPNTPDERIEIIDKLSTGFVYAVSVTGLTGTGIEDRLASIESYLERARRLVTKNPLLVGFGISSHEEAARLCQHTDGFIVGSSIVRLVEELWTEPRLPYFERMTRIKEYVRTLKSGSPS